MYILILYFPLMSSICCGFLAHYSGKNGAYMLALMCMFFASISSLYCFIDVVVNHKVVVIKLFTFLEVFGITIPFELVFDPLSCAMAFIVTTVSLVVHIYSGEYMYGDPHFIRFLSYLSLFTFFMLLLVVGGTYVVIFFG